jgi:hypothetical protein
MKIEEGKVYLLNYESKFQFGDLTQEVMLSLMKDGRFAAPLLERQLVCEFPELEYVDQKGHDHVHKDTGQKYDAKNFTRRGMKFMPSSQIGAGRKFNKEISHSHARELIYICCDIVEFPLVRCKFVAGKDLIEEYPKCQIPFGEREKFFTSDYTVELLTH